MKQTRTEERKGATYNFCITGNHDDGYLRRTNTEEVKRWGLNQNEWLQSALQIRMAYSSVVRSMRSLGSVNISNKRKRNSSRRSADSYRAGLQDDRRVRKLAAGSFRSEALAPGDESGRIDQQNSDVCDMNE